MSLQGRQQAKQPTQMPHGCFYHGSILSLNQVKEQKYSMTAMQRFMAEKGPEQGAVFCKPDSQNLSISKECECLKIIMLMPVSNNKHGITGSTEPMSFKGCSDHTSRTAKLLVGVGAIHDQLDEKRSE